MQRHLLCYEGNTVYRSNYIQMLALHDATPLCFCIKV